MSFAEKNWKLKGIQDNNSVALSKIMKHLIGGRFEICVSSIKNKHKAYDLTHRNEPKFPRFK